MNLSSGDLLLDRRFGWAEALAAEGDHAAAADLLLEIVAVVPEWLPGWRALALAREGLGDRAGAAAAWAALAERDPDGLYAAEAHRARLDGRGAATLPPAYVRALFDDYAARFDRHLRGELHYRGPELILDALEAIAPGRRFGRVLDLGCGTGLMGRALAGRAEAIEGIDLSPRMIAEAGRTGAYASLAVDSIEAALLSRAGAGFDLVTAADVLVYVAELGPVFAGVAGALRPGGLFAFTTQRSPTDADGLGDDMRHTHSRGTITGAAEAAGLALSLLEPCSTRYDRDQPVPGWLGIVRAPAPGLDGAEPA